MLLHLGLTINNYNDVDDFYKKLLGFNELRKFELDAKTARQLFSIDKEVQVILLQKENLTIELFLTPSKQQNVYNHVCIEVQKKEELVKEASNMGYPVITLERENRDNIYFLKDLSNNTFELKSKRG